MTQVHIHQVDAVKRVVGHRADAADCAHGQRASRPPTSPTDASKTSVALAAETTTRKTAREACAAA
eukprot:9268062-Alexandrium_andersonii.AAC.1